MTQKELRKMSRMGLIEIIYAQQQSEKSLQAENEALKLQLQDRLVRMEQSGSIAEAALHLNHIFEDAQAAAREYLDSLEYASQQAGQQSQQILDNAQQQADAMIAGAEEEAQAILNRARAQADAILDKANQQRDFILRKNQQAMQQYKALMNQADQTQRQIIDGYADIVGNQPELADEGENNG